VLSFLLSLKNKNAYLEKHHYINYHEDKNIIPLIISYMKETQNLPEKEILIGIANYFNICQEKFKEKHIKLDFNKDNLLPLVELTRLLDKEKFIYSENLSFIDDLWLSNEKLDSLLKNIKYIKNLNLNDENIFQIDDMNLNLHDKLYFLFEPFESRHLEFKQSFYTVSLEWSLFDMKKNIRILENLSDKIVDISGFGFDTNKFVNREKIEESYFTKKFPNGLENLTSFSSLLSPFNNLNSIIFKHVKNLKGLILEKPEDKITITNFLNNHSTIEKLEIEFKRNFNFRNIYLPNLIKLKVTADFKFFNYDTLNNFPKLECFYIDDPNSKFYQEEKFFKIKSLFSHRTRLGFTEKDFNFLTFLIKNKLKNNKQFKNCCIEANDVIEIIKFFNFMNFHQFKKLVDSIKTIVLSKSCDNDVILENKIIKNLFSNLHCIKIPNENYLPLLLCTKTLDKLEINQIKNFNCDKFNFLKDKKISEIIIKQDLLNGEETFLKFISDHPENFKQLKILKISRIYPNNYNIDKYLTIFESLLKMNLFIFCINLKCAQNEVLMNKFKMIEGVKEYSDVFDYYMNNPDLSYDDSIDSDSIMGYADDRYVSDLSYEDDYMSDF
jgi:hypothetical protein